MVCSVDGVVVTGAATNPPGVCMVGVHGSPAVNIVDVPGSPGVEMPADGDVMSRLICLLRPGDGPAYGDGPVYVIRAGVIRAGFLEASIWKKNQTVRVLRPANRDVKTHYRVNLVVIRRVVIICL